MTKLSFEIIVAPSQRELLRCRTYCDATAQIMGIRVGQDVRTESIVADRSELATLQTTVDQLLLRRHNESEARDDCLFDTLDLVFSAPGGGTSGAVCPTQDRTPLNAVFANPVRAFHLCGELQLACFVHLELLQGQKENEEKKEGGPTISIQLTALEYSRKHRARCLRQEFGSWLLEEQIENAVIATDVRGVVCFWNRFAESLYQYSREEAIGKSVYELVVSDVTQEQSKEIMSRLSKGDQWSGIFRVQRKDKTQFMAHVSDTPILDENGNVKYIAGVSVDCSPLHDAMSKLEVLNNHLEQEVQARTKELLERENVMRRLGAALQESETGVLISNEAGCIMWANDAVYRLLSVRQKAVLGACAWDLPLRPEKRGKRSSSDHEYDTLKDFFQSIMGQHHSDGQEQGHILSTTALVTPCDESDFNCGSPEKTIIVVSMQRLPSTTAEADKEELMITLRDVTADRKADEAMLLAERSMTAYFAHELRNPLSAIDSALQSMPVSAEAKDLVEGMQLCSSFMSCIMNNLLDARKMQEGKIILRSDPLSLKGLVEDVRKMLAPAVRSGVKMRVVVDTEDRDWVLGDIHRLRQIMNNVVSNAIKHTMSGMVTIVARWEGDSVRLECQDTGPGIPKDEQEDMFKRFTTRGGAHGSGLGLSIAKQLVDLMDGSIRFDSDPTAKPGTNCIILLPLKLIEEPVDRPTKSKDTHPLDEPLSISIVDDNKINQAMLKHRLKKSIAPNCTVKVASTGEEALGICASETFDVIVVDQYMEDAGGVMVGTDAIIAMRRAKIESIIIGCSGNDLETKFRNAGADMVWTKPMPSNSEIIQQLRRELTREGLKQ